ncbi:MAG: hypothetical protein HY794_01610 [Desulfarculus sp.]|nr:hypothetical protein [Desulfarculus sp.]
MTAHDDKTKPPAPSGAPCPRQETGLDPVLNSLFRELGPYLAPISQEDFQRLLGGGQPPAPAAAQAPLQAGARLVAYQGQGRWPQLPPDEAALEEDLAHSAHPQYRGEAWWRRTMVLMAAWNQARRRLGHLSPHFQQLSPHWQQPDWPDFNQARRQADSQGADYQEWTAAQFSRPGRQDQCQAPLPQEMHGPEAQRAWHDHLDARRRQGQYLAGGGPPYTNDSFDLYNPQHVTHAQILLDEIMVLAGQVFANDPQGTAILLAQAIKRGNLPPLALELVPQIKERVLRLAGLPQSQVQV